MKSKKRLSGKAGRTFAEAPWLGVRFINSISRSLRNDGGKQPLDVSSAESSPNKLVEIDLNPRISSPSVRNRLEKVCAAGKRGISACIKLGRRLVMGGPLYLRLLIRTRQEKIMVRLWRNLNGLPRKQGEGVTVKRTAEVNPNLANGKRQIFRLVDERHTENMTTMTWIGDAGGLDTEWESLLYDGKKEPNELSKSVPRCCNSGHAHVRVALTPNDQLTDGGPAVTSELPSCVAGPPFGAAFGSTKAVSNLCSITSMWAITSEHFTSVTFLFS